MVILSCPWCEAEDGLSLLALSDEESAFTCASCGTCVTVVDAAGPVPELAA